MKETINQLKKEIEKKFLKIRGWKSWEEYDRIIESSELDKNVRSELISICIDQTLQEVCKEIENRVLYLNKEKDKKGKKKVGDIVYLHIYDMINELKELLKKFQGEEK